MIESRSTYKKNVRSFNYQRNQIKTQKLVNARFKNTKLFWSMLKEATSNKGPKDITLDMYTNYFKAINNPESRFFQADEDILYFNS